MNQTQRKAERIRRIKLIVDHFNQTLFYIMLLFFTIKVDGERLIRSYIVIVPEAVSFIGVVFLSRWPDNPCSSLMHLLKCCAGILKFFLILFIMLKLDGFI